MTLKADVDQFIADAALAHDIVHGPGSGAGSTVTTEGGPVKTFARIAAEGSYRYMGAWQTATAYALRDVVVQGGVVYACLIPHTSGTFATDLAAVKWTVHANVSLAELEADDGATLIGYTRGDGEVSTVDAALRAAEGFKRYVFVVAGQSNAVGRASNPLIGPAAGYTFSRVYIWVRADARGFELLDPADHTQSYGMGADSHGIEPQIGYLFEREYPTGNLYIIKHAEGSTAIYENDDGWWGDWSPDSTGEHYDKLVDDCLTPALAELVSAGGYQMLGMWWMQGESDSVAGPSPEGPLDRAAAYYANLAAFFAALTGDVAALANAPKFIGRITTATDWTYAAIVRFAQFKFCKVKANRAMLFDTDWVELRSDDHVHYDNYGFFYLGQTLFKALTGRGPESDAPEFPLCERINNYPVELRGSTARATEPVFGSMSYRINGDVAHVNIVVNDGSDLDLTGATGNLRIVGLPIKPIVGIAGTGGSTPRAVGSLMSANCTISGKAIVPFWDADQDYIEFYTLVSNDVFSLVPVNAVVGPIIMLSIDIFVG